MMRPLADTNIWHQAVAHLRTAGHDVIWAGDWQPDPGDQAILAAAYEQQRIVVTLDKDFGDLAVQQRLPHAGIIRLVNFSVQKQAAVTLEILDRYAQELTQGAVITAEPGYVRIRSFPPEGEA